MNSMFSMRSILRSMQSAMRSIFSKLFSTMNSMFSMRSTLRSIMRSMRSGMRSTRRLGLDWHLGRRKHIGHRSRRNPFGTGGDGSVALGSCKRCLLCQVHATHPPLFLVDDGGAIIRNA